MNIFLSKLNIIFNIAKTSPLLILLFFSCTSIDKQNSNYTRVQLSSFKSACICYKIATGYYPSKLDDLVTNPGNVKNWRQFLEEVPADPWGNDYTYAVKDKIVIISSQGPTENQKDDISISFPEPQKEK
ncbi:MAG: type II secretion system protein GspG [Lentisphaeraceae bacterium]|nr:type II secretion system protein GspG [Lentisphaeraceae bacterium]